MCTACPPIAKTGKRQIFGINHENSDGLIFNRRIKPSNRLLVCLTSLQYDENSGPGRNYEVFC
jgi:hypothetical protein